MIKIQIPVKLFHNGWMLSLQQAGISSWVFIGPVSKWLSEQKVEYQLSCKEWCYDDIAPKEGTDTHKHRFSVFVPIIEFEDDSIGLLFKMTWC